MRTRRLRALGLGLPGGLDRAPLDWRFGFFFEAQPRASVGRSGGAALLRGAAKHDQHEHDHDERDPELYQLCLHRPLYTLSAPGAFVDRAVDSLGRLGQHGLGREAGREVDFLDEIGQLGERGRGLGSFLQRALMDRCRELGYHHLVAKIFADNQTSIRLHQRFGYRMVGVQKEIGIVDGRWQDVAILQYVFDENDSPTNQ